MGWEWRDETNETSSSIGSAGTGGTETSNFESGDRCSTRRIVKSQCKTEEVEPGKFVRKCEKTEQILKDCVGRPVEVVKSNTEYTEDDVTNEMSKGSFPFESSGMEPFNFPGLRSDIEAIERSVFGGLSQFFEAAEEMKNGFFQVFGTPRIYDRESSPSLRRGIPIEGPLGREAPPPTRKNDESAYSDFAGQVRDV
ncbi:fra a 1-associated protein [Macadamia integrifolia]|uniref:fra a 1-associated protein n=1 Tax=Macadamia integrifolia TaxID=60698 RepID=UPI001C4EBB7E|nr:fra a 1-associated protein [Macadamia integrifolia]